MNKPEFRFYKGENENPFNSETDASRYNFWNWEFAAVEQCHDA
jgi:hypothetical protein